MYLTKEDSKSEQRSKIEVKLFVTKLCPQCAIAIDRIDLLRRENDQIYLEIIDVTKDSNGYKRFERLAETPYYLIKEKFVVPGTSSKNYLRKVLAIAATTEQVNL